jgi:hypothetical protein
MARGYGSTTDLLACCLLSIFLLPFARIKRSFVLLAVLALLLGLAAHGWNIIATAFTESLSAINKTVGGVLFGLAVLVGVAAIEWSRDKKSGVVQKIFEVAGVGVFVGIGVWSLVFMYKVFIGVPFEVYREARTIIEVPASPLLLVPPPPGWDVKYSSFPVSEKTKILHVSMQFMLSRGTKRPTFSFLDSSDSMARNIRWAIVLWNTEVPDEANSIPIFTYPVDWLKPHQESGAIEILGQGTNFNTGTVLIGTAGLDCPNCDPESYILYIKWGESGWYAKTDKRWKGQPVLPADGLTRVGREMYFKNLVGIVPQTNRIAMDVK